MTISYAWSCLTCDVHGAGPKSDLAARKHNEATGHATTTHTGDPKPLRDCIAEVHAQMAAKREKRGA